MAYTAGGLVEYIGYAATGSSKGALVWQIRKVTYSGSNMTDVQFASSSTAFDKEWDERTSYSYS